MKCAGEEDTQKEHEEEGVILVLGPAGRVP